MQTNLTKIREQTIKLFDTAPLIPVKAIENMGAVCHPFAKSIFFYHHEQKKWLDISTPNSYAFYRRFILNRINSLSLPFIYDLILDDYKLTWFQLCKDYMSPEDFAYYLKHSWLDEEDPNQDPQVSREEVIHYFRQADKQYLMKPEDLAHYQSLPDTLTIYRGVSPHRAKFGLSWTADQSIAMWFKKRYESGSQGQLLTAVISKKHVLAYIDERNERELIVDVFKIIPHIAEAGTLRHNPAIQ
jgi:hypothetical protein